MKNIGKQMLACALAVLLLLGMALPTAAEESAFQILGGEKHLRLALYEYAFPYCTGVADDEIITWTVSKEGVLDVYEGGTTYAIGEGTVVLTATTADGVSDSIYVTVEPPIKWNGEGTKNVYVNRTYAARTFALSVEESGIYEIYVGDGYPTFLELMNANGETVAFDGSENYIAAPSLVEYLEMGEVYYLYTYAMDVMNKGGITYPLTVEKSTAYTEKGLYFRSETVETAVGDVLVPQYFTVPSYDGESVVTITSSNPDVVAVDGETAYALDVGTAVLTATSESGDTDTIVVNVSQVRVLEKDVPVTLDDPDPNVWIYAYGFYAFEAGEYTFRSMGKRFIYAEIVDENANTLDYVENTPYGEFNLSTTMNAEDVVLLYVEYMSSTPASIVVSDAVQATELVTSVAEEMYATTTVVNNQTHTVVYADQSFLIMPVFGEQWGAKRTDITYTASDPSILEDGGDGRFYALKAGTASVEAKAGNLVWEQTIDVIDYVEGDVTMDGQLTMIDAMTAYRAVNGLGTMTGAQQAIAEYNGDNTLTMIDIFTVYRTVSGLAGDQDPIPGDGIEDEWA